MKFSNQFMQFAGRVLLVLGIAASIDIGRLQADEPRFTQVTEGLLDNQTGLVWGHHFYYVSGYTAGNSIGYSWDYAMAMWIPIDYERDGVIDDSITYQDFSNVFYNRDDNDWRVPTRDELMAAVGAGLMSELDLSPEVGVQVFDPNQLNQWVWSSTKGGKKRGGFDSAYVVSLITGESTNITVGSSIHGTIAVRGVAAASGGKPGKGGGKK